MTELEPKLYWEDSWDACDSTARAQCFTLLVSDDGSWSIRDTDRKLLAGERADGQLNTAKLDAEEALYKYVRLVLEKLS